MFLTALVAVGLIGVALVAAALAVPLQPGLGGGNNTAGAGSVLMPSGVGANTKLNFYPVVVTVILGKNATVAWDNKDTSIHTVTATDGSFDSGNVKPGASWSYTFTTPGTFTYYCIYHSAWMKGTVVVKSA